MSEGFVLDASALLCQLNGERGAERIQEVLPRSAISAVNLSEVVSKLADAGGAQNRIELALRALHVRIVPFDEAQAMGAGALRPATKKHGLSLGDRACLALAKHLSATALTSDRIWADIAETVGARVEVVR